MYIYNILSCVCVCVCVCVCIICTHMCMYVCMYIIYIYIYIYIYIELAKSVQLPGDERDEFGTYHYYENYGQSGVRIANVDEEYNQQYARVQAARQTAFAEEAQRRGCSVAEVAAEADTLARERRARARKEMGLEAEEAHIHILKSTLMLHFFYISEAGAMTFEKKKSSRIRCWAIPCTRHLWRSIHPCKPCPRAARRWVVVGRRMTCLRLRTLT